MLLTRQQHKYIITYLVGETFSKIGDIFEHDYREIHPNSSYLEYKSFRMIKSSSATSLLLACIDNNYNKKSLLRWYNHIQYLRCKCKKDSLKKLLYSNDLNKLSICDLYELYNIQLQFIDYLTKTNGISFNNIDFVKVMKKPFVSLQNLEYEHTESLYCAKDVLYTTENIQKTLDFARTEVLYKKFKEQGKMVGFSEEGFPVYMLSEYKSLFYEGTSQKYFGPICDENGAPEPVGIDVDKENI